MFKVIVDNLSTTCPCLAMVSGVGVKGGADGASLTGHGQAGNAKQSVFAQSAAATKCLVSQG